MIKSRILTATAVILWVAPIFTVIWYLVSATTATPDARILIDALLALAIVTTLVRVLLRSAEQRANERMTLLAMRIGAQVAEQDRSKRADDGSTLRAL
ncbi:MAG TPA: hypothetical protein VIS06_13320 [Mycobacteriales bacterium]